MMKNMKCPGEEWFDGSLNNIKSHLIIYALLLAQRSNKILFTESYKSLKTNTNQCDEC